MTNPVKINVLTIATRLAFVEVCPPIKRADRVVVLIHTSALSFYAFSGIGDDFSLASSLAIAKISSSADGADGVVLAFAVTGVSLVGVGLVAGSAETFVGGSDSIASNIASV